MSDSIETLSGERESVIDLSALVEVFGVDDKDMFKDTFKDYLEAAPETISDLHRAIQSIDSAKVGAIAHKLKSSSRTIGANKLADICFALEMAGKEQKADIYKALQADLDQAFETVEEFIKDYISLQ